MLGSCTLLGRRSLLSRSLLLLSGHFLGRSLSGRLLRRVSRWRRALWSRDDELLFALRTLARLTDHFVGGFHHQATTTLNGNGHGYLEVPAGEILSESEILA